MSIVQAYVCYFLYSDETTPKPTSERRKPLAQFVEVSVYKLANSKVWRRGKGAWQRKCITGKLGYANCELIQAIQYHIPLNQFHPRSSQL